jgi:TPR repeat protein
MRNIHQLHVWTALLVAIGLTAVSPIYAQTAVAQRGVQDVTSTPASAVPAPIGPYYALVIGNNNYRDLNKLQTAVNDAKAVAQLLRDRYGFQTKVLVDATRADILDALDDYQRSLPENSNLLIYYAGHGLKEVAEHRAYWLPVDAQKDHSPNWINAVEITDKLRAIPSRHILVIADSCWSGDLAMRSTNAGITPLEHNTVLTRALSLKSRHIMSSGGDEPVADIGAENHSVFAGALLQSLNDMQDDVFTAEALLSQRVKPRVAGRSQQTPQYAIVRDSDADLGDFVFFRSKNTLSKDGLVSASAPPKSTTPSGIGSKEAMLNAKAFYKAGRYQEALPLFRAAAEAGDGEAAGYLGAMYDGAQGGLPKDEAQALVWYRKAADAGDGLGKFGIGSMYEYGRGGLPKDVAQAASWYRKAADAGDTHGMKKLGDMYASGNQGLPADLDQWFIWYRKAADAGDTFCMNDLGLKFEQGEMGLPKDEAQAVGWYRKAADAGETSGMTNLGRMYETGRGGLPKDEAQARSWYRKAANLGYYSAQLALRLLALPGKYSGLVKTVRGTQSLKPFTADLNLKVDAKLVSGDYSNATGDKGVVTGTIDGNALHLKLVSSKLEGECELEASLTGDLAKFSGVYSCSADGEHGTMDLSRVDDKSPSLPLPGSNPVKDSRFQVAGATDAATVLDTKTGLMWTKNDYWNLEKTFVTNWNDAMNWAKKLNAAGYGGYKDWVVPTIAQYRTINASRADREEYLQVFQKTEATDFWASNTPSRSVASYISFTEGYAVSGDKADPGLAKQLGRPPFPISVRLVRIGQSK